MAEPGDDDRPLRKIAQSFKELAAAVNSQTADVEVAPFSHACTLVFPLLGYLGIAFKFAEMDFVPKVHDLADASKSILTLQALLDHDMERNCVRKVGSHSRNLLRVNRGLDMIRVLFEQMLESEGDSFKDAVSKAYAQVLAPHHGWAIRKAVAAGLYALPTKAELLKKVNEDVYMYFVKRFGVLLIARGSEGTDCPKVENSLKTYLRDYIVASEAVIHYINRLFLSRELGIDW